MAAPNDRTFSTSEAEANRARTQGLGSGQREMDAGRDPSRFQTATNPQQRSFESDLNDATNADRPTQADFGEEAPATDSADAAPDRSGAGLGDVEGDLGAGTPANVDVHKLGQEDRPQEDWGETAGADATFSSNHTRRPVRTEAERGQGAKTRRANKDIISRRS
jgi:hypothetical protein